MKYIFKKKVENIPKNTTDIYVCDFCKKSNSTLYLYRIDPGTNNLDYLVWFCGDNCLNCYMLIIQNSIIF